MENVNNFETKMIEKSNKVENFNELLSIKNEIEAEIIKVKSEVKETIKKREAQITLIKLQQTIKNKIDDVPIIISSDEEEDDLSSKEKELKEIKERIAIIEAKNKKQEKILREFKSIVKNQRNINKKMFEINKALKEQLIETVNNVQINRADINDIDSYCINNWSEINIDKDKLKGDITNLKGQIGQLIKIK